MYLNRNNAAAISASFWMTRNLCVRRYSIAKRSKSLTSHIVILCQISIYKNFDNINDQISRFRQFGTLDCVNNAIHDSRRKDWRS